METIQTKKESSITLSYPYSSLSPENGCLNFEIMGQTNERSFEDRSVYLRMTNDKLKSDDSLNSASLNSEVDVSMWLQAEDSIELGLKLIEQGKFAMESNMINHQAIHMLRNFKKFLKDGIVEEVVFVMIDESPVNYGVGFRTYNIKPSWVEGKAPEYQEDFEFDVVIYWSPFEQDYHDQLDYYTQGCSYSFIGYDHDLEVERFKEQVRLMSGD